jgi:hypothetical protein
MISAQSGAGLMLSMMDDPRHRRIRGLVNNGFTPLGGHPKPANEGRLKTGQRRG